MTFFCCLEEKTNWLLKSQPYLVSAFGVIPIYVPQQEQLIDLYSAYPGKNIGACLINQKSQVQLATELGLVLFYSPCTVIKA